jgi:hypothetical protein
MKTIRISVRLLHNSEWLRLLLKFKEEVERFDPGKIGIKDLYMQLLPLIEQADKALLVLEKSVYTKEMEEADKVRDNYLRGFFGIVKNIRKQPNESKRKAGERLHNLTSAYRKDILSGNHAKESGAIYNLLEDLRGTVYAPDITLLGLTDWVNAIDQAEQAFLSFSDIRNEESVAKPKEELRKIRAKIEILYTAILSLLDILLLTAGLGGDLAPDRESLDVDDHENGEVFTPEGHGNITYNFVLEWNEIVKKFRNLLQQRAGHRNHKEEEDIEDEIS